MAKTAFFTHELFRKHQMDKNNPEVPERIEKINDLMFGTGVFGNLIRKEATAIEYSDILAAHDQDYISYLARQSPKQGLTVLNVDTAMNPYTWEAAQYAAGACCNAVAGVMAGEYSRAFCEVRPPGHHAHKNHSGGFCFLNNAAIAALYAIGHYRLKRVAVCDFDVHHGDGTTDILGGREDVLILDCFQDGLYPYAHLHHTPKNAIYTAFPEGADGVELRKVVDEIWVPKLLDFAPELIVVSAGFDGHRDEEQAQLLMTEQDYAYLGRRLVQVSEAISCCRGIIVVLEGGYNTSSLARSCVSFLMQLVSENTFESAEATSEIEEDKGLNDWPVDECPLSLDRINGNSPIQPTTKLCAKSTNQTSSQVIA